MLIFLHKLVFWFLRMFSVLRAAEYLAVGDPLCIVSDNLVGRAQTASPLKGHVIGVTDSNVKKGARVLVRRKGVVFGALQGAVAGSLCFLQASGGVGTTRPRPRNIVVQIGYALNETDLIVCLQEYKFWGGFQG